MVTPEAVVLELPIASAGLRVLARAIDLVIALAFLFVLALAQVLLFGASATVVVIVYVLAGFAVVLGYPVLMEALWGGRTVGKAVMGLRVVRSDGGAIELRHAAVRGALGLLEVWGTLGFVGLVTIVFSKRSQRLGDMVAGTLVLRRRGSSRVRALLPVELRVPPGCEQLVRLLDVGAMTPADYELVRSFLVRWQDFDAAQRPAVAARLAAPLWQRFRHPLPGWLGPDYYLACLGAAYQLRHPHSQVPQDPHGPLAGPGAPGDGGSWARPSWGAGPTSGNPTKGQAAPNGWAAPR